MLKEFVKAVNLLMKPLEVLRNYRYFFFFSTHDLFRQITVNNNRVNNFAPSPKIEKKFITLMYNAPKWSDTL